MNSGCWFLEDDTAVRVWGIVREPLLPERYAVDVPLLTRELWDSLEFDQLPPVSLGWKAEGAAQKLAAVLWAVALECKMSYAPLRSVCPCAALGQTTWALNGCSTSSTARLCATFP